MSAVCTEGPVTLLPREVRLVVERILLLTALPAGAIPAVRDTVLYSAAAGLGGLPLLRQRFEMLRDANPGAMRVDEAAPGKLAIDAGGQHAWVVLPMILDALGEACAREGAALASVANLHDPEELRAACALGARNGLAIFITNGPATGPATGPGATLLQGEGSGAMLLAAPSGVADTVLGRVLREGVVVEPALWWELHHLSNTALATDTPESRRHAGPVIVEPDGRVIGRTDHDDDTDISLLLSPKPESANAH
ncbi:hypothetical protein J8J14_19165 [Roseomonas sp. SSH11]|uniref:Uncharacterized protein n=1 Tax=Pararoseomonas baculiformis TaxID=2820812 RepID=A0ABS4AJ73_9PROT|nr:hypothetical protein [Pararoseomonas baculiformis]MBP0446899.1 hypothetical protein [Pararoseomonas baculiformis]